VLQNLQLWILYTLSLETYALIPVVRKKIWLRGYAHKQQKKNQGHKILRGSAKAYIHGAHPHSTFTMKSMNTTVKNYHTTLTTSYFSTWHSTHHIDTYNEKTI
jgi:hypothetical protein